MKGNINRLQVIPCDPLNVVVAHIGQGDIIPLQKRKPGIIVFEVQRLPHAFWHLIDKTEHTFISAGAIFIHQTLLEFQAQIFLIILLDLQLPLFSVFLLHQKSQELIIYIIMIIKYVLDLLPVDGKKNIPRLQFQLAGNTVRLHFTDLVSPLCHFLRSFLHSLLL